MASSVFEINVIGTLPKSGQKKDAILPQYKFTKGSQDTDGRPYLMFRIIVSMYSGFERKTGYKSIFIKVFGRSDEPKDSQFWKLAEQLRPGKMVAVLGAAPEIELIQSGDFVEWDFTLNQDGTGNFICLTLWNANDVIVSYDSEPFDEEGFATGREQRTTRAPRRRQAQESGDDDSGEEPQVVVPESPKKESSGLEPWD